MPPPFPNIGSKIRVICKKPTAHTLFLDVPGSKSWSNRAVVLAGMSPHPVVLQGFLFAEDCYWGLAALKTLGFEVECCLRTKQVRLVPPEAHFFQHQRHFFLPRRIFLGAAGTLARFFFAVILNWQNTHPLSPPLCVRLQARPQLCKRPLAPLIQALKSLNAQFFTSSHSLPVLLSSSNLKGSCHISTAVSGQFLSGLLLAASGTKHQIVVKRQDNLVQSHYVRMTLQALADFGAHVVTNPALDDFSILPTPGGLGTRSYTIEPDASTACYFIALAVLHNFSLRIHFLGSQSLQPDLQFISLLQKMGAHIELEKSHIFVCSQPQKTPLVGGFCIDFSECSDQSLTLGALALFATAPIRIFGVSHIRHHESDRIGCFVKNMQSLGVGVQEFLDGFLVHPLEKPPHELCGLWETWEDHRFAMAGFLIASVAPHVLLNHPHCVAKTAPQFFDDVQKLGFVFQFC